jgi:DNA ligase D-like protein (predicted 3'-phosphoesterase)
MAPDAAPARPGPARFVISQHDATTRHFDLRLELDGVLKSWAVPKGPSLDPAVRRLAVEVPDHDLGAGDFEGVHPGARRGTGAVIVWDEGTFELRDRRADHLVVELHGTRLHGGFALTRTGPGRWILVKMRDAAAEPGSDVVGSAPASVRSGRTIEQLADEG